ncbi:MAG: hypothetical protein JXB49_36040 [Bacteroidales bacterium]|nr:hypothetical protein [Bacteroidales bacterium]
MKFRNWIFLALIAGLLSSCLTVEKKQYAFELTGKESGKLTIKYINIMSIMDEEQDVSETDFNELITSYIEGDEIEKSYPEAKNIKKRLFEENGQLCGEVTMDFESLKDVGLYLHNKKAPLMYYLSSGLGMETFESSNGEYGGDVMPVVFWGNKEKKLNVATVVTEPDETTISLLDQYKKWK